MTVLRPNSWTKSRTKCPRIFSPCYSQTPLQHALRFLFLQTHETSYSFYSSVIVHSKGERRKTWQKIILPSLYLKKSIQKPQVWELSRLCPETSMKLYVHEFGFWYHMWIIFLFQQAHVLFDDLNKRCYPFVNVQCREWLLMIYRGPGYLLLSLPLSQSSCVSPVELTDRERGGREGGVEAESCDGKKAWCTINHSILSGPMNKRPELDLVFRYLYISSDLATLYTLSYGKVQKRYS